MIEGILGETETDFEGIGIGEDVMSVVWGFLTMSKLLYSQLESPHNFCLFRENFCRVEARLLIFADRLPTPMRLFLLDYGAGNVQSLANTLENLGHSFTWITSPADFDDATVSLAICLSATP
jgi:hypothetical protein